MSKFSSHSTLVMERIARIPGGRLEGEVGQLRIEKEFLEWQKSPPPPLSLPRLLPSSPWVRRRSDRYERLRLRRYTHMRGGPRRLMAERGGGGQKIARLPPRP